MNKPIAEYLIKYGFVNDYGQIDVHGVLCKISELCNCHLYRVADKLINELYEISTGTEYDGINNDLFVLGFDDECQMFLLLGKISDKLYGCDFDTWLCDEY